MPGRNASMWTRVTLTIGANLASGIGIWALIPVIGEPAGAISFLPALLAGWLLGWRIGLVAALATQLVTIAAFTLRGSPFLESLVILPIVLPVLLASAAAAGGMGALVDRMRGERDQLAREIARREAAEADLRTAREAAERAERLSSLGVLVAGVAHEINNPLAYIRANAELAAMTVDELIERADLPADVRAELDQLREGEKSALRGIERIAYIARGLKRFAGGQVGPRERMDLRDAVDAGILASRPHVPPGVKLVTRTEQAEAVVNGNEIIQIVMNLVINAAQAMGNAGTLTVTTARVGDEVVLSVADTGPGIDPKDAHRIFTPFHTTKQHGTGLGLSLSYRIAADHGGKLDFTSAPGAGTTFRLHLPAAQAQPYPSQASSAG